MSSYLASTKYSLINVYNMCGFVVSLSLTVLVGGGNCSVDSGDTTRPHNTLVLLEDGWLVYGVMAPIWCVFD